MIRVGPNQDINDPTDIIRVGHDYQVRSDNVGIMLARSDAQDPNASGLPIVDIAIPFRLEDGSTDFIFGADLSEPVSGVFDYDKDMVARANIVTYVNLPELFREYWYTIRGAISGITDFFDLATQEKPGFGDPDDIYLDEVGILGTTESFYYLYTFIGTHSTYPIWSGLGPIDYNSFTFTQLLNVGSRIAVGMVPLLQKEWDTNYWYEKQTTVFSDILSSYLGFGKFDSSPLPTDPTNEFVQFHNPFPSSIVVSLSVSMSSIHTSGNFILEYDSWAEIDDLDVFPTGSLASLGSFIQKVVVTASATKTLTDTRNIVIPPGKSAFIKALAADNVFTSDSTPGSYDVTLILNGRSVSYSHIFT